MEARASARKFVPHSRIRARHRLPDDLRPAGFSRLALCFLVCWLGFFSTGCEACSAEDPLAKLIEKTGQVDRDTAEKMGEWAVAEVGARFELGDAVKTGASADAVLDLDDGSELALDESTIVRFSDREPGSGHQALQVEMGSASLEAAEGGAILETAFGLARLEGGTTVRLHRNDQSLRYEVLVGQATLEDSAGKTTTLEAGESLEVAIGSAVLEPLEEEDEEAKEEDEEPEPETGPIQARVDGQGVTLKRVGKSDFEAVDEGETQVDPGSVFEVPTGAHVAVSRGQHRATLKGAGSYVVGAEDSFVQANNGSMSIQSDASVRVAVPGGVIVTHPGASADVTNLGQKGTRVRGTGGQVTVRGTKATEEVAEGQEAVLSPEGEVTVEGRGLEYADVQIKAGETVVIHDPSPPTAVRFLFGDTCEGGVVLLSGRKGESASGVDSVALPVAAGRNRYSLHCLEDGEKASKPAASGKITVLHDAGTRAVPKKAPSTYVEVDGRKYTVLYQNQLPQVTLNWSKAPEGVGSFKLHLSGASGSRTFTKSRPAHVFPSGTLGPGTHYVYFEGGGRVSRKSTISIRFDNATPTASLKTPVSTGAKPGSEVKIAGTALPGWDVQVDGKEVPTDATGGFSLPARMPSDRKAIAVRLSHPQRGTHIYLRRAKGRR